MPHEASPCRTTPALIYCSLPKISKNVSVRMVPSAVTNPAALTNPVEEAFAKIKVLLCAKLEHVLARR